MAVLVKHNNMYYRNKRNMKNLLLLAICILFTTSTFGQEDKAITESLTKKYGFVSYGKNKDFEYYYVHVGKYIKKGGGNVGVCDLNGKIIIQPIWDAVDVWGEGNYKCVQVEKKGKKGIRDLKDKEIISCKYDIIRFYYGDHLNNPCYSVINDKKVGLLDIKGNTIFPCIYSTLSFFPYCDSHELMIIGKGGEGVDVEILPNGDMYSSGDGSNYSSGAKYALFNLREKKFITGFKYDYIDYFPIDLTRFNVGGTIIDTNHSKPIVEGGKWGFLDREGNEIIPAQYDMVTTFEKGIAKATKDGETFELQSPLSSSTSGGKGGIDVNIPKINIDNPTLFVIAVGNEKFSDEADVPYAENDAKVFKEYCQQTLGVSENHIRYIANAGYNDIRRAVNWLKQGLEAYGGEGCAIFYYAGHGIPDEAQKTAYILPVDGIGSDIESAYSLERLYQTLGEMPAKSITVFLDACFSGAKRDGGMLASARGVAIKTKAEEPKGKMVVFSAAQGDETAYPYKSQQHGMFTYYLLRKLQETKGDVTLGELADYITREVKRQCFDENSRSQTPSVKASASFAESWRNLKLK